MIFCKVCGDALNLFETHAEEVCYAGLKQGIEQEKPVAAPRQQGKDLLADAMLGHEEGNLVLRSAEGWVLWSAPDNGTYDLESLLTKARRICEIRKKRKK